VDGIDIRFTRKGDSLYAFLLGRPEGGAVVIPSLEAPGGAEILLLGAPGRLTWSQDKGNLVIQTGALPGEYAWGFKMTPAPHST